MRHAQISGHTVILGAQAGLLPYGDPDLPSQPLRYEDRRKYVYRLHRHLYGMKDSPRGWDQLFSSVCTDFGLTRLKSDECVFVKFVNNSKTRIQHIPSNLANIIEATALGPKTTESTRTVRTQQR